MDEWKQIAALHGDGIDLVVVTIVAARGSVPGQTGAKAVVTAAGMVCGNLGGGKVEAKAVEAALAVLTGSANCSMATWNLQRDVGMTCGGEMSFLFEKVSATERWHIAVFGAGHVCQALVPVLATLPCRIDVFDTRGDWLAKLPVRGNVNVHRVENFEEGIQFLNPASYVLCISKGHSTDRPVLRDALRRFPELPFVGVIGSASKRAVLMRELAEDYLTEDLLEKILCPVGLALGGNDPAEIAISIAAQLLQRRDQTVAARLPVLRSSAGEEG